jgi:predicted small secreted protein
MNKKAILIILSAALLLVAMTACHTVQGAGEDIESVGQAIKGD